MDSRSYLRQLIPVLFSESGPDADFRRKHDLRRKLLALKDREHRENQRHEKALAAIDRERQILKNRLSDL
jgi:hypothetical protein